LKLFFVDTSALVKRHIIEQGSLWVRTWILPRYQHEIYISRLTTVEIVSVLMRRQRENTLRAAEVHQIRKNFGEHVRRQYRIVEMNREILDLARRLLKRRSLRTLDAIQLASALHIKRHLSDPIVFVTADRNLLNNAVLEGLLTDDPHAHP
jgi:uncharacterized protein